MHICTVVQVHRNVLILKLPVDHIHRCKNPFIILFRIESSSREYNVGLGSRLNSQIVDVSSRLMCELQLGLPTLSNNVLSVLYIC